jgi:cold shock CspA family protein
VQDDIFDQFNNIRLLLIDDRADLGYADVVACLLRGSVEDHTAHDGRTTTGRVETKGFTLRWDKAPDTPCAWLERLLTTQLTGAKINVIGASETENGPPQAEPFDILLLDLRLFDTQSNSAKQKSFLQRLIRCCGYIDAQNNPSISKFLRSAERFLISSDQSRPGLGYLLLLPALLATVDPSLPIIIFSSTHQRELVDDLAPYPNVITTFAKPLVSGYDAGISSFEHISQLRRAVINALILREKRIIYLRLVHLKIGRPPIFILQANKNGPMPKIGYPLDQRKNICNLDDNKLDRHFPTLEAMRRAFLRYFIIYIVQDRFHDFSSVPYEFLEASFAPEEVMNGPDWSHVAVTFTPPPSLEDAYDRREARQKFEATTAEWRRLFVAIALKNCRNRKAHGYGAEPDVASYDSDALNSAEDRAIAILQFLTLLDFIEAMTASDARKPTPWQATCEKLRNKYTAVVDWPASDFLPNRLTSITAIRSVDVALFSLKRAQYDSPEYFQRNTYCAIDALSVVLERTQGIVKSYDERGRRGFIVRDSDGRDIFVRPETVEESGLRSLVPGQRICFNTEKHTKYGLQAVKLVAL